MIYRTVGVFVVPLVISPSILVRSKELRVPQVV